MTKNLVKRKKNTSLLVLVIYLFDKLFNKTKYKKLQVNFKRSKNFSTKESSVISPKETSVTMPEINK